jgi:hypothetical protein
VTTHLVILVGVIFGLPVGDVITIVITLDYHRSRRRSLNWRRLELAELVGAEVVVVQALNAAGHSRGAAAARGRFC